MVYKEQDTMTEHGVTFSHTRWKHQNVSAKSQERTSKKCISQTNKCSGESDVVMKTGRGDRSSKTQTFSFNVGLLVGRIPPLFVLTRYIILALLLCSFPPKTFSYFIGMPPPQMQGMQFGGLPMGQFHPQPAFQAGQVINPFQNNLAMRPPQLGFMGNPMANQMVNPLMNHMITQGVSPMANPLMSHMLNPQMNPMLTPQMNPTVNPLMNPMANQLMNPSLSSLIGSHVPSPPLAFNPMSFQQNPFMSGITSQPSYLPGSPQESSYLEGYKEGMRSLIKKAAIEHLLAQTLHETMSGKNLNTVTQFNSPHATLLGIQQLSMLPGAGGMGTYPMMGGMGIYPMMGGMGPRWKEEESDEDDGGSRRKKKKSKRSRRSKKSRSSRRKPRRKSRSRRSRR